MRNLIIMIKPGNTNAMQWNIYKLLNIIIDNKSAQVSAVVVFVGARGSVYTGFACDSRIAARTAISYNRIARWPVIIGVAVVNLRRMVTERL